MKDDLSPFIAAYRAEHPGTALDARALRERVLTATWRRRRRRVRRAVWLLPIAAVLVGTGALAASGPARESVSRVLAALGVVAPAASPRSAPRHAVSPRARAAALGSSPSSNDPATAVAAFESPSVALPAAAAPEGPSILRSDIASSQSGSPRHVALDRSRASAAHTLAPSPDLPSHNLAARTADEPRDTPPESTSARPPTDSVNANARTASSALAADIAAYRAAHELHFSRSDDARALAAWNAYLARFPHGTFTPEARLNRAVCLARLGKTSEAQSVLHTLAASADPYTSSRAQHLLGAGN